MDGEPVTGEPSQNQENTGGDGAVAALSYTGAFDSVFPAYMVMGMSYDEFWRGPAILAKYYREAYKMRKRDEEWARWRQGAYIYDALLRVAPVMRASMSKSKVEPGKYPDEPYPLTAKEAKEREQRRELENTKRFIAQLEAESERNKRRTQVKEASEDGGH